MKVIVNLEVENCKNCPHYEYGGTSWSEDIYTCNKTGKEVGSNGIPMHCPFMPTMETLIKSYNELEKKNHRSSHIGGYEPGVDPLWPI